MKGKLGSLILVVGSLNASNVLLNNSKNLTWRLEFPCHIQLVWG